MSEEEKYIIIPFSYYNFKNNLKDAIEAAKKIKRLNPRIFKIEKEIKWKEHIEENDSEKDTEKEHKKFYRYDIFD